MISGCLAPTGGRVLAAGFDVEKDPLAAKSRMAYLPEVPPLYQDMTVEEYLSFALALKNARKKAGDRAPWPGGIIRDLGIDGVRQVLIRNLSKGFRQRVGIAAAAAGKPLLLLLDEPASGLDPRQAADFRSLLKRLAQDMAVIVSSHDLHEITSLCSRIIIMREGGIVFDGSPGGLARMGGGEKTVIEASGDLSGAEAIVRRCAQDARISVEASGGLIRFTVHPGGEDFREQVFRSFAAASGAVSLHILQAAETNLEELFISLTSPDGT
jgi:ABC-2 type transport system ATP-binding protein